jgi:ATP-dependent Clp protease ATP-binding subunit ClpC
MRFLGQWEERLEEAIASLSSIPGILCVENLLDLVKAGGTEAETSIAAFLAPYLESGELRLVTEATADEISACERLLPGLIDRFHHLPLAGFTPAAQTRLLHRAANYFDVTEGIRFPESAAERAGALFERFQPHAAFPGKVFDFLSRLADRSADGDSPEITSKSAEILFSETTGLPSELVAEDAAAFEVDKVATFLEAKLVGQGRAVSAVARSLAKFGTGLNDPTRPLGVFLFCGPTGVGKTQMVRRLGDFIFPGKPERERLIRLDMSEYAGYDAPARLLGDIGGAPSELLRHIRASPFSVVLLDEIEKADPSVFDVLLGMFDEGRLTDAFGRTTSFCSSWIIMTSNLGAGAAAPMGFGTGDADELAAKTGFDPDAAAKFFRPEFFNRIDQTVVFDPLNRSGIKEVTRRELVEVAAREGLAERGLTLSYDDTLVTALAKAGFDPTYGARPLQRAIDAAVTAPLARHLVRNPDLRDAQLNLSWDAEKASIRINAPLPAG